MKTRYTLLSCLLPAVAASLAQAQVPVRLDPFADAPVIGHIESIDAASAAPWPAGSPAAPGWKPVNVEGRFELYLRNDDIGKDLSAKPGSAYYLEPRLDAPRFGLAKASDKSDVLSVVDARFVRMRVDTIAHGYVQTQAPQPQPQAAQPPRPLTAPIPAQPAAPSETTRPANPAPDHSAPAPAAVPANVRELQGRLIPNRLFARNRTGTLYRLVSNDGQILAYVDTDHLGERARPRDLVEQSVRVIGMLEQTENGDLIIVAQNMVRAN